MEGGGDMVVNVEVAEEYKDGESSLLTIQVTQEQESAMEAFFQINSWQLIKESRGELMALTDGMETRSLAIRVTAEQEAAMEAFFQINNWVLIKEVQGDEEEQQETETVQIENIGQIIKTEDQSNTALQTLVEEVQGLQEVQVTATGVNGQPQIITVYTEGGARGLPQSLLTEGSGEEKDMPGVIIQEITLPEGMSLDQGLVIANPSTQVRRVIPRGTVKPGDKIHKCHVCGKTFKQIQSFNGHYASHFGAKPFQCEICNTGFTLKAALVAHNSIHTGAKPFACSLCHKSFRRKDDMISHLRTHTGEKPYECDICGKKFKYRNQIPKHRRAHTGEKPYQCKSCEKAFTSNIHLRRHERTHTGERPYKCAVCGKAFTQYGHLQAHTRIHTDERPFVCTICGRGFREKKVMKKHEALHTSERPYKCEECGKGFLRQSNLELHAVMHQKNNGNGQRVRPRPKKKKLPEVEMREFVTNVLPKKRRLPDAEMREFVANVLSNVKKVDSGMQTENFVHGVPSVEDQEGAENLSALVNLAVGQEANQVPKIEPISEIEPGSGEEQYTLVMQEDGEGYLISNYEGQGEEIVTLPSQQVEVSTRYEEDKSVNSDDATYVENPGEIVVKTLEEVVEAEVSQTQNSQTPEIKVEKTPTQSPTVSVVQGSTATVQRKLVPKLPQINVISNGQTIATIPVPAGKIQIHNTADATKPSSSTSTQSSS